LGGRSKQRKSLETGNKVNKTKNEMICQDFRAKGVRFGGGKEDVEARGKYQTGLIAREFKEMPVSLVALGRKKRLGSQKNRRGGAG